MARQSQCCHAVKKNNACCPQHRNVEAASADAYADVWRDGVVSAVVCHSHDCDLAAVCEFHRSQRMSHSAGRAGRGQKLRKCLDEEVPPCSTPPSQLFPPQGCCFNFIWPVSTDGPACTRRTAWFRRPVSHVVMFLGLSAKDSLDPAWTE